MIQPNHQYIFVAFPVSSLYFENRESNETKFDFVSKNPIVQGKILVKCHESIQAVLKPKIKLIKIQIADFSQVLK